MRTTMLLAVATFLLATPASQAQNSNSPLEVQCTSPAMTFTLGYNDKLDAAQKEALCSCLGSKLNDEDLSIMGGTIKTSDPAVIDRVTKDFADALHQCGVKF